MVRLSDLPADEAAHLRDKPCPVLGPTPWALPAPPAGRRVSLVTTAGIHVRGESNFLLADASYRVIPADTPAGDIVMSHASVNFDRTGFQEDLDVVFPLTRFAELAERGEIEGLADFHYSFMGAGLEPHEYESSARELARMMRRDAVDTAFLTPV